MVADSSPNQYAGRPMTCIVDCQAGNPARQTPPPRRWHRTNHNGSYKSPWGSSISRVPEPRLGTSTCSSCVWLCGICCAGGICLLTKRRNRVVSEGLVMACLHLGNRGEQKLFLNDPFVREYLLSSCTSLVCFCITILCGAGGLL